MGYVSVIGLCIRCEQPFMFSPTKVPSVLVEGKREPICASCVVFLNALREENGMEPIIVSPDAYLGDDENAVDWGDA
jgi:hypothetical protein